VTSLLKRAQPEGLINLAGFSSVARAEQEPLRPWMVNAMGTLNILAAIRDCAPRCRVLLIGSGEMYGWVEGRLRQSEEMPLKPIGVYASSKVAAELAGFQFSRGYELTVISARAFNQLGRGQDQSFAVPTFASQIAAIRQGRQEPTIKTGNLEVIRDLLHVEDTVAAYRLLLISGEARTAYNVCSGVGRTLRSVLEELMELAGVTARLEHDPNRLRSIDIPALVGNADRIRKLGWIPKRTVRSALEEVLDEYNSISPLPLGEG
jgi:GDP-4-dehydro-6-deoxy-D-mannose reductase